MSLTRAEVIVLSEHQSIEHKNFCLLAQRNGVNQRVKVWVRAVKAQAHCTAEVIGTMH